MLPQWGSPTRYDREFLGFDTHESSAQGIGENFLDLGRDRVPSGEHLIVGF